ncbi:uncharacterized protein F4822DRAFT_390218 [Hypoxylon trugodes]|uniref:uncharacterized protein n=1 Tax=Hypoxylon trugodes TaxID=326681 RepID=UPI002199C872|nr:uncharacterized protein F4822DRAFT_390218 [Hypoxylon trugodes]KAI1392251.1 hypothetical protein F4822DRAFT_390218 [Hypoxylon trugodes]
MQGDIFQMERMNTQIQAPHLEPIPVSDSNTNPQVAIYNEDDLSHLLYVNHLHHNHHGGKVFINHVYRDGYSTPLESLPTGTQTPVSETNETPILSDCESDFDEGVYLPSLSSTYSRGSPLGFEDGFEFPVFLGRQAEEPSPPIVRSDPVSKLSPGLGYQRKHDQAAAPKVNHVSDISGPLMSWWPEPPELMEHQWAEEKIVKSEEPKAMPVEQHVSRIEGPLMSWWPTPVKYLEYEWDERFYE